MTSGPDATPPDWLRWVRVLQSLSQAGLAYPGNEFDRARYAQVGAIAAEMAASVAGLPTQAVAEAFAADAGHPTPKVDVRGAVLCDGRVLLVRERIDGRWTLPGGWADPGDPPSVTVEREVREEAGYHVRAHRLVAVHDRDHHNPPPIAYAIYKLFFLCELVSPEPVGEPDHEILEVAWCDPHDPPPLSTGGSPLISCVSWPRSRPTPAVRPSLTDRLTATPGRQHSPARRRCYEMAIR